MSVKNPAQNIKHSTQDISKGITSQIQGNTQPSQACFQVRSSFENPYGIFQTHQQKIQATFNFQSLFRKKSHLYSLHKNKKKLLNKNQRNQAPKNQDPDCESKTVKKGHWTAQQNRKYHWFLELHNKHFILKHLRRTDKIFKTMSSFIGTRQAQQCRSHHQKMQKKYKNFYHIIIQLRIQYYGTCNTGLVKAQLEQNGYIKQSKQMLIEQNTLRSMQNNDKQSGTNTDKEQCKKQLDQDIIQIHNHNSESMQNQPQVQESKQKQGHLFFAQNYQKELNYKPY